jgi:hypothetical protein
LATEIKNKRNEGFASKYTDMKIGKKTKRKARDEKSIVMIRNSLGDSFFRRLKRLAPVCKIRKQNNRRNSNHSREIRSIFSDRVAMW